MKFKFLSFFLTIAMVVTLFPANAIPVHADSNAIVSVTNSSGTTGYTSWGDAVYAVNCSTGDQTITLLSDIKLHSDDHLPRKTCTIDGANHKLLSNKYMFLEADTTFKDFSELIGGEVIYCCPDYQVQSFNITFLGTVNVDSEINGGGDHSGIEPGNITINGDLTCHDIQCFVNLSVLPGKSLTLRESGSVTNIKNANVDGVVSTQVGYFGVDNGGVLSGQGTFKFGDGGCLILLNHTTVADDAKFKILPNDIFYATQILLQVDNTVDISSKLNQFDFSGYSGYKLTPTTGGERTIYCLTKLKTDTLAFSVTMNGETKNYGTWAEAVKAVNEGTGSGERTIILNKDITLSNTDVMPSVPCTIDGGTDKHTLTLAGDVSLGADITLKDLGISGSYQINAFKDVNTNYNVTMEGTVTAPDVTFNGGSVSSAMTVKGNLTAASISYFMNGTIAQGCTVKTNYISPKSFKIDGVLNANTIIVSDWARAGILSGSGTIVFNTGSQLLFRNYGSIDASSSITIKAGAGYNPKAGDILILNKDFANPVVNIDKLKLGTGLDSFILNGKAESNKYDYSLAGPVTITTSTDANAPSTLVDNTTIKNILTDDDKAAIGAGSSVSYQVKVAKVAEPTKEDTAKFQAAIAPGQTLGMYIDISLFKTVTPKTGNASTTQIANAANPITLTVTIPKELRGHKSYFVPRLHGGVLTNLQDQDSDPNTVTINTDGFSTYALAYTDDAVTTSNYTVTFVNGNDTYQVTKDIASGNTISMPLNPSKSGYTFNGWVDEKGNAFTASTKVTSDMKVTARWTQNSSSGGGSSYSASDDDSTKTNNTFKTAFTDIENHWAKEAILYVTQKGYFNGTSENTFSPNDYMTRGMLVSVLYRMEGSPSSEASHFTDVNGSAYYAKAVAWANEGGIVSGISGNQFSPDSDITREQLALIIYNFAKYKELNISKKGDLTSFDDESSISDWAEDAMNYAVGIGIISGRDNGKLDPKGKATRAEVAAILYAFMEK